MTFEGHYDDEPLDLILPEDLAEMLSFTYQGWRRQQEERPISLRGALGPLLKKQPAPWIAGIAQALGTKGYGKAQQITKIGRVLADPFSLTQVVEQLPAIVRRVLKAILNRGGWAAYDTLVLTFGDDTGDTWFWVENPPRSPVGIARLHGLLFVGTVVEQGQMIKVALIPRDIREALTKILALEEDTELAAPTRDTELEETLKDVNAYFNEIDDDSLITREQMRVFLTAAGLHEATRINEVWADLEFFIFYLAHLVDEIASLDDLRGYHISEFMHQFIDSTIERRITVLQKRTLLSNVLQFLDYLADQALIKAATYTRISAAAAMITANKRSLAQLDRPMPLGGEPVLRSEQDGHLITFTFNDLWLGLAAIAEHNGSLAELHEAARGVPDGAVKRKRLNWLMRRDLTEFNQVLGAIPPLALKAAVDWFQHAAFNRGSAWSIPGEEDT